MENEIKNIIREFANPREETLDNAVKRICALFNVSGSEDDLKTKDCKHEFYDTWFCNEDVTPFEIDERKCIKCGEIDTEI